MRGAARSLGRVGAFARVRRTKQHPIQIVPVPVGTSVFFRVGDPSTIANACFATAAAVSDDELAPSRRPVTAGDFYFRSAQADDRLKDDTDYLLHDTVVGRMTLRDRSLAHRIMTAWKRTNSTHGAILVQQVLERIVEEDEAGNGRVADVSSRLYHIAIEAWAHSGDEECGRRAEAILSRMEERHRKLTEFESRWGNSNTGTETSHTNIARARPDARCFHLTLHALAKSREEDVTERAEHLVQRMEDMAKVDPESPIQPQTTTYNCLMNVYASRKGTYGIGQIAEDLLLGMAERNKDGDFSINPDTLSFNTVLKAWLNSGECAFESACRAEQLLRLMAKLGADGHNFLPDAISFLTCLNCFEKAVSEEQKDGSLIVDHVDGLIDLAEETGAAGDDLTRFFNTAISIIIKSGVEETEQRTRELMSRMEELRESGTLNLQPISDNTKASILNQAILRSDTANEAEQLVLDIIENHLANTETNAIVSDSISIGKLIHSILQRNGRTNVEIVDKLLTKMERAAEEAPGIAPHWSHFNMAIASYAKISDDRSAFDALELLRRQEQCFEAGNIRSIPDSYAYCSVLTQLAKKAKNKNNKKAGINEMAHDVLMMMVRQVEQGNTRVNPSTIDYNIVIGLHANARKRSATDKAMYLFRIMQAEKEAGNSNIPDVVTMSSLLNALVQAKDKRAPLVALELLDVVTSEKGEHLPVDANFFQHVISALCQSKQLGHVDAAHDILVSMRFDEDGENFSIATTACCNDVVKGYCSTGTGTGTASNAQAVLVSLVSKFRRNEIAGMPDRHGFNAVISAWVSSKDSLAMSNVEKLITLMGELHNEGCCHLEPTPFVIFNAIRVYANFAAEKGVVDRAQSLMDGVGPAKLLYDAFLNVVAKSKEPEKYKKAKSILEKLKETDCKEDIDATSYNIALNACAFVARPEDKEGALETATQIFEECRRQNKADEVTYGTYLKALRKCSSGTDCKRESFVQDLIKQAKDSGHFGYLLRKELKHMYRDRLAEKLGIEAENKIPSSWQRNAKTLHVRKSRQRN